MESNETPTTLTIDCPWADMPGDRRRLAKMVWQALKIQGAPILQETQQTFQAKSLDGWTIIVGELHPQKDWRLPPVQVEIWSPLIPKRACSVLWPVGYVPIDPTVKGQLLNRAHGTRWEGVVYGMKENV